MTSSMSLKEAMLLLPPPTIFVVFMGDEAALSEEPSGTVCKLLALFPSNDPLSGETARPLLLLTTLAATLEGSRLALAGLEAPRLVGW